MSRTANFTLGHEPDKILNHAKKESLDQIDMDIPYRIWTAPESFYVVVKDDKFARFLRQQNFGLHVRYDRVYITTEHIMTEAGDDKPVYDYLSIHESHNIVKKFTEILNNYGIESRFAVR